MSKPLVIFSGDGHIGAEPETYRPYLDPETVRSLLDDDLGAVAAAG
jgi:hypothetical protein